MNGRIAKLLRKTARTNPYGVDNIVNTKTLYQKSKRKDCIQIAPGLRLTYKYLKRFYKRGEFTAADARKELQEFNLKQNVLKIEENATQ